MFGIGTTELLLVMVVALLVLGPKKLPEVARGLGRAMGEMRRASQELKDTIEAEARAVERPQVNPPSVMPTARAVPGDDAIDGSDPVHGDSVATAGPDLGAAGQYAATVDGDGAGSGPVGDAAAESANRLDEPAKDTAAKDTAAKDTAAKES